MNAPVVEAAQGAERMDFVDSRRSFAGMLATGALLQLVTFGFYRFWLATRIRRHLWSHTTLGGDVFEYWGTAKELLGGFLIGLAILSPSYFLYFLAGVEAERIQEFASLPLFVFLILFGDFARYRGLRYRLRRTVWRGVGFSMDGSGWAYALRSGLWMIPVALTLGLAHPWRIAALERYKMSHVCYGDRRGRFDATGRALFRAGWPLWLAVFLYASLFVAFGSISAHAVSTKTSHGGKQIMLALVIVVVTLLAPVVLAAYRARVWRWWAGGVELGGMRLTSDLDGEAFVALYYKTGLAVLAFAFVGHSAAVLLFSGYGGIGAIFDLSTQASDAVKWTAMVQVALFYLVLALAAGVIIRLYLTHDMWRAVASSVSVTSLDGLQACAVPVEQVNALGEGLSEGFDLAG